MRIFGDDRRRLLSKLDTTGGALSCWPYLGARTGWGYGNFAMGGRYYGAHKAAHLLFIGPVPEGMEVDHLCHKRNECAGGITCPHRPCANPAHLGLASHRDNDLRGCGESARNARVTHCPAGHAYDEANTYRPPSTKPGHSRRDCRACKSAANARYRTRQRQARSRFEEPEPSPAPPEPRSPAHLPGSGDRGSLAPPVGKVPAWHSF